MCRFPIVLWRFKEILHVLGSFFFFLLLGLFCLFLLIYFVSLYFHVMFVELYLFSFCLYEKNNIGFSIIGISIITNFSHY